MKNFLCIILSITLLSIPSISIAAKSNEAVEIEYFDDGSYIITTIDNEPASSIAPLSNTTTKSKTAKKYYDGSVVETLTKTVKLTCSPTGTFS